MKQNTAPTQTSENWQQVEDYLNSDFQNDTRPRRVNVDVPLALATQKQLRAYAQSWIEADYRIAEWPLKEHLEKDINSKTIRLFQAPSVPLRMREGKSIAPVEPLDQKPFVIPVWDYSSVNPGDLAGDRELDAQMRASSLFFQFILSPFWNLLRICARCSTFFLNRSGHENKVFCSAQCATLTSTEGRRHREYKEKLEKLERAIAALQRLTNTERRRFHWKRWLADKTSMDQRFITRAVNQGKVRIPMGLKQ